mgnify:FL=1
MELTLEADKKYSICTCGLSQTMPYCDNTHREYNAENNTEYKSLKITPDKDTSIEVTCSRWESVKKNSI